VKSDDAISSAPRLPPRQDHPADTALTRRERAGFFKLLTRGFTTKKGGHGFGLHSSALAARALSGGLPGRSQGAGRGAILTVKIPLAPGTMKGSV
jgi:hypothetical protein